MDSGARPVHDSSADSDWLEFYIDDVRQDRISGNVNWQQQLHTVTGAQSHTLRWRYVKDSSAYDGTSGSTSTTSGVAGDAAPPSSRWYDKLFDKHWAKNRLLEAKKKV